MHWDHTAYTHAVPLVGCVFVKGPIIFSSRPTESRNCRFSEREVGRTVTDITISDTHMTGMSMLSRSEIGGKVNS